MAALPYMQLYIADYLADTMHLSTEEHGAYLLLMFNYWQTGRPIPKNRLAKITRMSNERWNTVEESLSEFFIDTGTEWVHERIEFDLETVHALIEQKSAAGKASAAKRKAKKQTKYERDGNACSTGVETPLKQEFNGNSTNKDKDKDKDKDLITDPPLPPREKVSRKNKNTEYSPEFENAWATYPRRAGGQDKAGAFRAWNARIREGVSIQAMLDGTRRYADFVVATGTAGTQYVKQAKTFYGPSNFFLEAWEKPEQQRARLGGISVPDKNIPAGFRG